MTPYELMLSIEAYMDKSKAALEEKISLTWLGEYYHRVKKLPSLKDEIKKMNKTRNDMTNEEMLEMVKSLNVQFGGNEESGE